MDPWGVAVDKDGNIFISDYSNHRLRRIDALDGTITTIAGVGIAGFTGDNGPARGAAINDPTGINVAPDGKIYFADSGNYLIRMIDTGGVIHTFAGNGYSGAGSPAIDSYLYYPVGVAVAPNGDVLIADIVAIYRVGQDGILQQITPTTMQLGFGGDGGPPAYAQFALFADVAGAPNGDILLADLVNYRVRRIRKNIVNTVAGTGIQNDVPARSTFLSAPNDLIPDGAGGIWFADRLQQEIRGIEAGQIKRIFGDGYQGSELTRTWEPEGLARASNGNLYIADSMNHRILRYVPGGSASIVAGGNGPGSYGGSGSATSARLNLPSAVVVGRPGFFYIADFGNCLIRQVVDGAIRTIAGNGSCGFSGDGGPATEAGFNPIDLYLAGSGDGEGTLYVSDYLNHRIRTIDLATGIITTFAGIGTAGFSGDGGPAAIAQFGLPMGIDMDQDGNLYFADYYNAVVRKIDAKGVISTIAGVPGEYDSTAEAGPATAMPFDPVNVRAMPDGTFYVSDEYNDRVRLLRPAVPTSMQMVEGDNATGAPGDKITLRLKIVEAMGFGVSGIPVDFKVTNGTATVSSSQLQTASDGTAQLQVTLGDTQGPVTVTATAPGLPSLTFHLTIVAPPPAINQNGVVGAGLSVPAIAAASTDGILSIFGNHFGGPVVFQKVGPADLVNGQVPTNFQGICVEMNGTRAPVFGVSDTQVNFQSTAFDAGGTVEVIVISGCDTLDETRSSPMQIAAQSAAPEFFYFGASDTGVDPVAATDAVSGAIIAPANMFPGSGYQPAQPGETITIYATGFGATDPMIEPGAFFASAAAVTGSVKIFLNGEQLPAENILYVGATPGSPGLYQVNLTLPANLASGNLTIVIEIDGIQSSPGAYLAVDSGQ